MIKQPDTSTRAGRHAVELASDKFRIQFKTRPAGKDWCWVEVYPEDGAKTWSWDLNDFRIHPDDLQAWSDTQKRDVWTTMGDCIFARGKTDRFVVVSSAMSECEILTALNGAPAADGMVINPDRYWYERSREADAEITELKRQLAAKDGSIKHFLDEIEELQTDNADLIRKRTWITNQLADKDRCIAERNRLIVVLNTKLDEADSKTVTAQDWELKKEPATVSPGPIETIVSQLKLRLVKAEDRYHEEEIDGDSVSVASTRSEFLAIRDVLRLIDHHNGDRCGVRKGAE
jgi:hypothetical protein